VAGARGEQGAGGGEDDGLDAGVAAVQVQDVAGGGGVAQSLAYVLGAVGGGRYGLSVGVGRQVEVSERRQLDRGLRHGFPFAVPGRAPGRPDSRSTAAPGAVGVERWSGGGGGGLLVFVAVRALGGFGEDAQSVGLADVAVLAAHDLVVLAAGAAGLGVSGLAGRLDLVGANGAVGDCVRRGRVR
jgi:hypothetical protein